MACQFDKRIGELSRNLTRLYTRHTTETDKALGVAWYPMAHRIVLEWSETYGRSIANVACVIAALSPQCAWERNLVIADDVLAGRPPSIGGALNSCLRKAQHIRDDRAGQTLPYFPRGPKVASFACNLAGDYSIVTVDTHGIQAALADVQSTFTLRWGPYACFAEAYRQAALKAGLEPAAFQAVVWHTWKRLYPWGRKQKLRQQWSVIGMEDNE